MLFRSLRKKHNQTIWLLASRCISGCLSRLCFQKMPCSMPCSFFSRASHSWHTILWVPKPKVVSHQTNVLKYHANVLSSRAKQGKPPAGQYFQAFRSMTFKLTSKNFNLPRK
eukprot:jgi/Botrbrau1/22805/Bobra.0132s0130.1